MTAAWIQAALAAGLPAEVLELHFQPVVGLADGSVHGAEGFARWRDPEHGFVPASEWIPHAESTGAIIDVARSLVPVWISTSTGGAGPIVSFNMMGRQLLDDASVAELLAVPAPIAAGLAIEIPHLQFFVDAANAAAPEWSWVDIDDLDDRLARLSASGYSIWLDDFGDTILDEGPLTHPSIDLVKLDRCLLDADPTWLRGVVRRIHDAGKRSLLEGIETSEHDAKAIDAGIELGQGFRYSPPLTIDRFAQFCSAHS